MRGDKKVRRPRIYISGPITNGGSIQSQEVIKEHVGAAITAMLALIQRGMSPLAPQLTYYADPSGLIGHEVWLDVDTSWIDMSDALLRLPGESKGADFECDYAAKHGIPVFADVDSLAQCFEEKAVRGGWSEIATPEQHLSEIQRWFTQKHGQKYRAGQREHGGRLFRKPVMDFLVEEVLDFCSYVHVLKGHWDQVRDITGAVRCGGMNAEDGIEMIRNIIDFGNPEGIREAGD
jgi:hypothetical protein